MFDWQEVIRDRMQKYAANVSKRLTKQLGFGYDGMVFATDCQSAIKGFKHGSLYANELRVYQRLYEYDFQQVRGCKIPTLLGHDDDLHVIEMGVVSPPYVLDFAGAYLDFPPDYPDDVMAAWRAEKREQYGEDWPWVQEIMQDLASIGVYLADVKPGNITLR